MSDPYIGEVRIFAGMFAPVNWLFCQGQILNVADNPVLFNLIGTTYGGDGQSTFALPDLRGRVPIHHGARGGIGYTLGLEGGAANVSLVTQSMPIHNHLVSTTSGAGQTSPSGAIMADVTSSVLANVYDTATSPAVALDNATIGMSGRSAPHDNMQPYLCINYIIALGGFYPTPP